MTKKMLILLLLLDFIYLPLSAQKLNPEEVKVYTEECTDLIAYLEFSLNSIGDNELTPKEKDIIISESYSKFFRDSKVQIEDDLVPDREAVTNKDVQAYLKDVDFFFTKVIFSYKILSVNLLQDESKHPYFKIHALRTLDGTTINNDSIHNEQARYIEVSINPDLRQLKIVSIYTTKIDETIENIRWWNELPVSWKEILGNQISIHDSLAFSRILNITPDYALIEIPFDTTGLAQIQTLYPDSSIQLNPTFDSIYFSADSTGIAWRETVESSLRKLLSTKELNVSGRLDIHYLDPLSKLGSLHSLDISKTNISDLYPIRNLVDLEDLNISNTPVNNLDALVYSMALQNLDLSNTKVYSLLPLSNLVNLKVLNLASTQIDDIQALSSLKMLVDLKIKGTMVSDLSPIKQQLSLSYLNIDDCPIADISAVENLTELKIFSCNNTIVNNLKALSKLKNLNVIYCENTEITNLNALNGMEHLSKIYCDNTLLGKAKALEYMKNNVNVLVVYESKKLKKWYEELSPEWKNIFNKYVAVDEENPTKEQLHQVASITDIDISGQTQIASLEALSRIPNLKKLNASGTEITSLDALYELHELNWLDVSATKIITISALENSHTLSYLDISNTNVTKLNALHELHSLKKLNIQNTKIEDITQLMKLSGLRELQADGCSVDAKQFEAFSLKNPKCIVIYQSEFLNNWWNKLNNEWQQYFMGLQNWKQTPNSIELHELCKRQELVVENNRSIHDITALSVFSLLKKLSIIGTQISDINILAHLHRLESIELSQNPIMEIGALSGLKNLTSINISNTQVDNLDWILPLAHLQYLDISGTQIKNIKSLNSLYMLETLVAFNTRISSLKPLNDLVSLRKLKIYNTKVSSKKVQQFKNTHPSCVVDYF